MSSSDSDYGSDSSTESEFGVEWSDSSSSRCAIASSSSFSSSSSSDVSHSSYAAVTDISGETVGSVFLSNSDSSLLTNDSEYAAEGYGDEPGTRLGCKNLTERDKQIISRMPTVSTTKIANGLDVSARSVRRHRQRIRRQQEDPEASPIRPPGRPPTYDEERLEKKTRIIIKRKRKEKRGPQMTLKSIVHALDEEYDIDISERHLRRKMRSWKPPIKVSFLFQFIVTILTYFNEF